MPGGILKLFPFHTYGFCNVIETETIYYSHIIKHVLISQEDESIGAYIKYNRQLMNLRQKDLARYLNLNVCTIIKYETNLLAPSNKSIKKIRDFFNTAKKESYHQG